MLSEVEIMTTQRNVKRVNVEDLTEAAIQKFFLKKVLFKDSRILKRTAYIFIFLKSYRRKACSLAKNNSLRFFLNDFAFYVLRFLNILRIFILQNTCQ